MLAWIVGLGYTGDSVADAPTVPTAALRSAPPRISPTAWQARWRTVGWILLRPAWGL